MKVPDLATLEEFLEYDENSPSGLRWKKKSINGRQGVAGTLRDNFYWLTGLSGRQYQNGILVLLLNGFYPKEGEVVDHLDGNPSNNLLTNLRFASRALNSRNRKLPSSNSTGVTGIYVQGDMMCCSWYGLDKTMRRKYFSIKKNGYENALDMAIKFRADRLTELNKEGAGYTERHFTQPTIT